MCRGVVDGNKRFATKCNLVCGACMSTLSEALQAEVDWVCTCYDFGSKLFVCMIKGRQHYLSV